MGVLQDLIRERFKLPIVPLTNRQIATVDTAVLLLFRNDPDRLGFTVINLSTNNLFIGPYPNVSSARGILVPPNGGAVGAIWDEDFSIVGLDWFAVGSAAGTTLLSIEYTNG